MIFTQGLHTTHNNTQCYCCLVLSPQQVYWPTSPHGLSPCITTPLYPFLPPSFLPSFLPPLLPAIIFILYLCRPAQCLMSRDHMALLLDPTIWEHFQMQHLHSAL